ncbi:MAG TPA: Xaa-Pro peptidase family protein [Thermoanaerobaculia bacterium]|nr:Xaa-Pro peptidase family protein [Thermoanaerobaculia bacterium]
MDRLSELRAGLEERGCDALLVLARSSQDTDLAPFVGGVHLGDCQLIVPREGRPCLAYLTPMERQEAAATGFELITPEQLELNRWENVAPEPGDVMAWVAEKSLLLSGLSPGRVALAGHGQAGVIQAACKALSGKGWQWVAGNALVQKLRKRKTAAEVAAIRGAARGTAGAMRMVARRLAAAVPRENGELWLEGERLTVARLRSEISRSLAEQGLEQPKGNILAPAEEGAIPHSSGTPDRVLRAGESIVVDLFPRGALFADCTRTFCVPHSDQPPPAALRRAHSLVLAVLERAHLDARAGVRGWDLHAEACARFEAEGFPTLLSDPNTTRGYVHNLGHGVGFDLHEQPIFRKAAGAEGVLREGDVFTLEPGLYDPEGGYAVRLEDLVFLGPDGLENLTPLPYEMDPRAWG